MPTDDEVKNEGMTLLVAGIKALRDFLDGKAAFEVQAVDNGPGRTTKTVRFKRDQA